ncbi:MAG: hypothetical protein JRG92_18340, partial [Deltaproteobacteria bacterium]|nr:hypothetical protein [Deltaproteobacteria bacterium]
MLSRRATRPYPVTSWSVVNALGTTTDQVVRGLRSGRPMLSPAPPGTGFATACGAVSQDLAPLQGELAGLDSRNNRFVACALEEMAGALEAAVERWG